jgi:hypothetical protein
VLDVHGVVWTRLPSTLRAVPVHRLHRMRPSGTAVAVNVAVSAQGRWFTRSRAVSQKELRHGGSSDGIERLDQARIRIE